ncbi:MAG: hypothetical protein KJP04_04490, partial [Arenicella sp.]|nr:hypothetical protein [Arenicella sp.]
SILLHPANSIEALQRVLGEPLDMDAQTAAYGLVEVVDENMANAARVHAVENGEELSEYAMIAFGGAAPLHACRLCEKLGVNRLLVPPGAGVGSAIGFLRAPFSFEANRSVYMRMSDFDPWVVKTLLTELQGEAISFVRTCDADAEPRSEFKVYMRYSGQGWEIPIVLNREQAINPQAKIFRRLFEQNYSNLFGRVVEGMDIEITVWAVNATTPLPPITPVVQAETGAAAEPQGTRLIFDSALGAAVNAAIIPRYQLQCGQTIRGPAAVSEGETTVILPSNCAAVVQADGTIDISLRAACKGENVTSEQRYG